MKMIANARAGLTRSSPSLIRLTEWSPNKVAYHEWPFTADTRGSSARLLWGIG